MSQNTQQVRFLSKVDIEANWTSNNPILKNKEIGYVRENGKYKIGDGITNWNNLSYAMENNTNIEVSNIREGNVEGSVILGAADNNNVNNGRNAVTSGNSSIAHSSNTGAFGYLSQAGSKGYKILGFFDENQNVISEESKASTQHAIKLSSLEGLAVGQTISIRTTSQYVSCGTLTVIPGIGDALDIVNFTTTKEIQFKLETDPDDPEHFAMENYLIVDGHPELGDTVVTFNGAAFGEKTIAQERDSFAAGRQNIVLGQYGFGANRGNTVGYASAGFGYNNKALANYSFVAGNGNTVKGQYSTAFNSNNQINGKDSFACGASNQIDEESIFSFAANRNNKITFGSDACFACGASNDINGSYCGFAANADNELFMNQYSAVFGQANVIGTNANFSFVAGHNNSITDAKKTTVFGELNRAQECYDSMVIGVGNICNSNHALRRGKYCKDDSTSRNSYADVVGNGSVDSNGNETRSNAYTLDWSGNAWYAGTVEATGIILTSPNGTKYKITVNDNGELISTAQ